MKRVDFGSEMSFRQLAAKLQYSTEETMGIGEPAALFDQAADAINILLNDRVGWMKRVAFLEGVIAGYDLAHFDDEEDDNDNFTN